MGQWDIGPTADAVIGREPYSLRCMMKTGDIMNKCSCEEYLLNQIIVTEFKNWTRVNECSEKRLLVGPDSPI